MNNLISRYVHAVTHKLPLSQQQDVADELSTSIEDMIANRTENGENENAATIAVLTQLGDPALLASKYQSTKQYLIGPKWFETYKLTLLTVAKIVLPIILFIIFLGNLTQAHTSFLAIIVNVLGSTMNVAIAIAFWVTLTFALLEWYDVELPKSDEKEWTPASLPEIPGKRQISIANGLTEFITTLLTLAFTIYGLSLPIFESSILPTYGLLIIVIIALSAVHNLILLIRGNWNLPLFISGAFLNLALGAGAIAIASQSNLLNPELIKAIESYGPGVLQSITWVIYIIAGVIVFVNMWEIVESARYYFQTRSVQN